MKTKTTIHSFFVSSIALVCAFLFFQWLLLSAVEEQIQGNAKLVKDFQRQYAASSKANDQHRKDFLVEVLLRHEPDRDELLLKLSKGFLKFSFIFGLCIAGINFYGLAVVVYQKKTKGCGTFLSKMADYNPQYD